MSSVDDKKMGTVQSQWLLDGFKEVIFECGLIDMAFEGYPYTWHRKEGLIVVLKERLDSALDTTYWLEIFPHARLRNLFSFVSDHSPIFLDMHSKSHKFIRRNFRFENKWLAEPELDFVTENWSKASTDPLLDHLDQVVVGLEIPLIVAKKK